MKYKLRFAKTELAFQVGIVSKKRNLNYTLPHSGSLSGKTFDEKGLLGRAES